MISIKIDAEVIIETKQVRIKNLQTRKILAEKDFLEPTQSFFYPMVFS
ncbi:MAG: hypothetical protein JJU02_12280 [Cryomorphaceae bacterium]|nr:hypothetical protein [Cryomorphaceae bacterium]